MNLIEEGRIPKNIQERIREQEYICVKKWVSEQDPISMFEGWKKLGCPDVETVNKMIW